MVWFRVDGIGEYVIRLHIVKHAPIEKGSLVQA